MATWWRNWGGADTAEMRAQRANESHEALLGMVPKIAVNAGAQVNGYLIEFRVEGELVWTVWRATEPSYADLVDLKVAAATGVAARGHCAFDVLATDVQAFFAGTAPAPEPAPAPAPEEPKEAA